MNSLYNDISVFALKILFLACFLLSGFTILSSYSFSQTGLANDTTDMVTDPVIPLHQLVKYSNGIVKNNLNHDGKLYGFIGGESKFIKDFKPQETFSFETGNFDSIQFFYEWDLNEKYKYVVDKFFLKVYNNEPFTFVPVPVQELSGLEMVTDNVKRFKGKKLYEINIIDDVDPGQIEVAASSESLPYIDILKIDTATYQIKLKGKNEFSRDVSKEVQESIKKGEEVIFPIGIVMKDKSINSDVREYKIFLKKKKKPKVKR